MDKHLLLVTYTVYEGDDTDLVNALERAESYELDETAWLVYTDDSARAWYHRLEPLIYEEDELMVLKIRIEDVASDEGLKEDLERWLHTRLKSAG
ncbi:MAG: hypothetical protein MUE40_20930 [Anaerolineae bacterium]|jgi:hypothetical protein|nr:hypothetical protein [Anaerolineae bacterium]